MDDRPRFTKLSRRADPARYLVDPLRRRVRIEIDSRTVGYFLRRMAVEYRAALGETAGYCSAKIVSGHDLDDGSTAHFAVKLRMAWPPRLIPSPDRATITFNFEIEGRAIA